MTSHSRSELSATSQEVAALYESCLPHLESSKARVKMALKSFADANENPATSPNLHSTEEDRVGVFVHMLQNGIVRTDAMWLVLLLRSLKVLSRKQVNRLQFGDAGLRALVSALANPLNAKVAAEGANVLLNVCYEVENVHALLKTPGVQQLLLFLTEDDEDVQANAAGAIQSICFQEEGRKHVHDKGGIASLSVLLGSRNPKVATRAVGAVHNLSSDAGVIRDIRAHGAIPTLVSLLRSDRLAVSGSAAGALQNVSREVASRLIIRELDAVPPLARLLSAPDVQAQVCASGALLNIVGPDLDRREAQRAQARAAASRLRASQQRSPRASLAPPSPSGPDKGGGGGSGRGQGLGLLGLQEEEGEDEEGMLSVALPPPSHSQRRGLGRLMALCMATAAIYDSVFEAPPPLEEVP